MINRLVESADLAELTLSRARRDEWSWQLEKPKAGRPQGLRAYEGVAMAWLAGFFACYTGAQRNQREEDA